MKKIIPVFFLMALALAGLAFSSCASMSDSSTVGPADLRGGQASLKMKNKLYTDILVRLEGPEIRELTVPARSSKTIQLKSGIYQYIAGAQDFRPISRYKALEPGRSYTIYF